MKLFLQNPLIASKVKYYSLIRGTLNIRVVLNGTPYDYGLLSVRAYPYLKYDNVLHNWYSESVSLPGVSLNPAEETIGEFQIPFLHQRKWIELSAFGRTDVDLDRVQGVDYVSLCLYVIAPLLNSQAATASVGYTIYAWLTDAELAVPTAFGQLQGPKMKKTEESEYSGPVSKVASAVASAAGALKSVPLIGAYARATEVGATTLGNVASLFGFSRPAVVSETTVVTQAPLSSFANGAGGVVAGKLTIDPFAETEIDPNSVGLSSEDEMSFPYIFSKPGIVEVVEMTDADTAGDVLTYIPVSPLAEQPGNTTADWSVYYPTPLGYLARGFGYWTGTLRFNVKVICSRFHRGRVQLSYRPRATSMTPGVDITNATWNTILDLSTDREIDFDIPWTQAYPWLPLKRGQHPGVAYDPVYGHSNGSIEFSVVNPLLSSKVGDSVSFVVTIRGGDDLKFAKPYITRLINSTPANRLYGLIPDMGDQFDIPAVVGNPPSPQNYSYSGTIVNGVLQGPFDDQGASGDAPSTTDYESQHFGESVPTIRSLIKRYSQLATISGDCATLAEYNCVLPQQLHDYWEYKVATDTDLENGVLLPTFFTWYKKMYTGFRGSTRYRVVVSQHDKSGPSSSLTVRATLSDSVPMYFGPGTIQLVDYVSGNGTHVVPMDTTNGYDVEVPYYYPFNFQLTSAINNPSYGCCTDLSVSQNSLAMAVGANTQIGANSPHASFILYASVGDDAQLFGFKAAPAVLTATAFKGRGNIV